MFTDIVVGVDGLAGGREAIALTRSLRAPGTVLTLANVHARSSAREASRELLKRESEHADDGVKLHSVEDADVGRSRAGTALASGRSTR